MIPADGGRTGHGIVDQNIDRAVRFGDRGHGRSDRSLVALIHGNGPHVAALRLPFPGQCLKFIQTAGSDISDRAGTRQRFGDRTAVLARAASDQSHLALQGKHRQIIHCMPSLVRVRPGIFRQKIFNRPGVYGGIVRRRPVEAGCHRIIQSVTKRCGVLHSAVNFAT
ncbi:hypothetical protein SDC9_164955 [bioreactor metagenome]|uniref:Uncharacterized protein n=1 Tax=bioreactor metagenome TaxID=1076179 RepID=A0A645FV91_9ZZZZ